MSDEEFPDLSGKLVALFVGAEARGDVLEYCEWRKIAGRQFIVGRIADIPGQSWAPGREAGVAWDRVDAYYLFRDRAQYVEAAGRADKLRKSGRGWFAS